MSVPEVIVKNESNPMEESCVTMLDVLEQEKELEEEYAAVLGASDEKCCTYSKGPIKRQALYSCLTCCPEARTDLAKCAGICLACSYKCHENHELIELYTKRNFRCDCPTERLSVAGKAGCLLNKDLCDWREPANDGNIYNQNFQGLYCICHRPYPDPESSREEVMLQCAVCEDWFHLHHLNVPPENATLADTCSEMICERCMQQHEVLQSYTGLALKVVHNAESDGDTEADVTQTGDNDLDKKIKSDLDKSISEIMNMGQAVAGAGDASKLKSDLDKSISEIMNIGNEANEQQQCVAEETVNAENKRSAADVDPANEEQGEPEAKRRKSEASEKSSSSRSAKIVKCRRPEKDREYIEGATFWSNDWRNALCQCEDCMTLYKQNKIEFLLDVEDSAKSYEELGMKRVASESSTYEQGIKALASIGRVQQIDAITEYNHMKEKLMAYLQSFAVNKKVVTEEDINRFFEQMRCEKNASITTSAYQ